MRDGDLLEARATTRRAARTFSLACRLLPRDVRDDVYLLYLVFRRLDDAVDEGEPDAEERLAAVEAWAAGAAGRGPASREARVLEELARRHPLPRSAFADFCRGMRDDLERVPVETEDDLDRYCYRVAGTVGVVMAHMLGMRDAARALPAAAALGMAMQRTNVLRDIDEDLAVGRVYVPTATLGRLGGSLTPGERERVLRDQIARADALYDHGCDGIPLLVRGRRAIRSAAAMYREILRQIERDGYGARPGRAVVPRRRKLVVAALAR
ncbi:MAG TPA: squalene/phytoene synthase family protein [Capillimicrobium sp.]|nr:squalene/phytoene synthase family protein [Capillimicrobium sp.]